MTAQLCLSATAEVLLHDLEGVMMRRHTLTNENRAYNERQQLVRRSNNLGATSPFGRLTRRPEGTLNCRPL